MIIRRTKPTDKKPILSFLHKTFQWGDYIERVWDMWLARKTLLTVEENKKPIGIGNASFSKHQVWIEGLRIHPKFRRKGYASKLVSHIENIAKKKRRRVSRMLIAQGNTRSLRMARSLDYKIEDKFWLYNMRPKKHQVSARIATNTRQLGNLANSSTYSESWEWLPLDKPTLNRLIKKRRVIVATKNKKPIGVGIWNESDLDKDVLQLGYINGTKQGMKMILHYMQNKAQQMKSKRIQVLMQQKTRLDAKELDKRMLFCLMRKDL
ncbi:MAG: GNAT family N-acetyltransferase [Candidatus Nitrosotenuis sp.]